ncbi:sigma54 specific transcriptional regulator with PAS/PAC sensor, Fis family [Desulfuromonas soudanensis]|uniref:Sigma54 specific transcriptional regulator with PAS/PAC sensor, Fis family n=1 Tax=Desulfuromonas soudanensis TaxID=1603606 RepID=A0A0M5IZF9_9BACT|nr:sigma 54-interacting transcriptional regulator [Desulfuromonas soudanensis]ALC17306.1 sigma54 specific transcriptional regulator with PAS/PAC sensor, Fis family [Desulfuromonas soudanensis]
MGIDKKKVLPVVVDELRLLAEEQLAERTSSVEFPLGEDEARRLVHELEVTQVELEMQNDELRHAQVELERSRDKYLELYDFAPIGYFTFDERGLIREVNLAGSHLLGIERGPLARAPMSRFIVDAEGRTVFSRHLKNVLQKEGMQECEVKLTRSNGSVIHTRIQSIAVASGENRNREILSSILDVSVAKQLELANREAREFAENIVETLREPLVVLEAGLKILTANHCFYEMFQVTPEETVGKFIYDLGNRQWDNPRLRVLFEEILPRHTVINDYEVEHDFPHIGHRIFLLNARQIFRGDIGSDVILLAMEDITERRQLGNDLQKAHKELESVVLERTAELTRANKQLTEEIADRKKAEMSLQEAYGEIKLLKDRLQEENIYLRQEVDKKYNFGEIIGQSQALSIIFSQVQQVAPMNATVLLLGETGTGKGVVARAIHRSSTRKDRSLITVNCTTLPATLVESELFGREKGAFTGSDARQIGRFELANGGTIFLDEIGEMPLELQSKLLRVIQDGEFERLGSPRTIKTDVRIIAATNRNLKEEIRNGKFREDLYYRLNVFPITLPPLRQRKEDIPLLVDHFVTKFNAKIGKKIETVSSNTLTLLQKYHWPGNVRELESVIERAVITSQGNSLQVLDRFEVFPVAGEQTDRTEEGGLEGRRSGQDVKGLVEVERDHIVRVLQKTGWRIEGKNGAALILGLNASTLRARMRKFGIVRK